MTPLQLTISSVYYILVAILTLFSLFAVYLLIRYGRSIVLSLTLSIVYALFFITILSQSYQTLHLVLAVQ